MSTAAQLPALDAFDGPEPSPGSVEDLARQLVDARAEIHRLRGEITELQTRLCWSGSVDTASGAFRPDEKDDNGGSYR